MKTSHLGPRVLLSVYLPLVRLYVNSHLLEKEASLLRLCEAPIGVILLVLCSFSGIILLGFPLDAIPI